jgi:predicted deacylase
MDTEILNIDNQLVERGEYKSIKILVGRLPSDTRIYIQAHVYRSMNPGPVVLCLGGVHGDEINGVEIIRKSIEKGFFENLERGTVIAIPLLNIFGFINFSRDVPDGKDVNRSFPGSTSGSLASRTARTLTKKILPHVDYALDFHTGGSSRYNYPQIRYTKNDNRSFELAKAFDAPIVVEKPLIKNSFRKIATDQKIPVVVFEAGESIRLDGFSIEKGIEGIKNVMYYLEMTDKHYRTEKDNILVKKTTWLRAPYSGLFIWTKDSGKWITKSEPIGVIKDPFGLKSINVLASRDGIIIGHNNASVVNQGDALFHIGYETEKIK